MAAMPEPDPEPELDPEPDLAIETIAAESIEELVVPDEPAVAEPEPLEAAEPVAIAVEETEVDDEPVIDEPVAEDDGPVGLETFAPAQEPDTTPETTPDTTPEPAFVSDEAPALAAGTIAVLDANAAWHGPDAIVAHAVEPDAAAADRIRELAPSACLANLATPGVLPVLVALREANDATPIVACAVAPGTDAGLAFGSFDVLTRPVDPEHVRRQVERLAPAKATVVMVGSESAILIPLRQGLLALGATVRTAWNRQQAIDLADSVRPDVVIVDLASEAAGGAALVAELAQRDGAPRIVLVAAGATQHDALATELATHAAVGTVECAELVRAAARP
jgi:DNA-binding response OmpR family regulator